MNIIKNLVNELEKVKGIPKTKKKMLNTISILYELLYNRFKCVYLWNMVFKCYKKKRLKTIERGIDFGGFGFSDGGVFHLPLFYYYDNSGRRIVAAYSKEGWQWNDDQKIDYEKVYNILIKIKDYIKIKKNEVTKNGKEKRKTNK